MQNTINSETPVSVCDREISVMRSEKIVEKLLAAAKDVAWVVRAYDVVGMKICEQILRDLAPARKQQHVGQSVERALRRSKQDQIRFPGSGHFFQVRIHKTRADPPPDD
jgi:hypothetical protein